MSDELDRKIDEILSCPGCEQRDAEIASLRERVKMLTEDLGAADKRIESLRKELACPDCGCADQIDAESQECGCDSPVCARDGSVTLAAAYASLRERLAATEALLAKLDAGEGARCIDCGRDFPRDSTLLTLRAHREVCPANAMRARADAAESARDKLAKRCKRLEECLLTVYHGTLLKYRKVIDEVYPGASIRAEAGANGGDHAKD